MYTPSKRLIICEQGVDLLEEEKKKYDDFLDHFRSSKKKGKKKHGLKNK